MIPAICAPPTDWASEISQTDKAKPIRAAHLNVDVFKRFLPRRAIIIQMDPRSNEAPPD
jgi:hypothetical protein